MIHPMLNSRSLRPRVLSAAFVTFLATMTSASAEDDVVSWIQAHAVPLETAEPGHGFEDLRPLAAMVGDARIVALGESTHGAREMFQMKHRLVEFLVEEMGFNVFAIEASLSDCVPIGDYVATIEGDAAEVLHGQRFWTWDTEEVLALIEWMRRYNEDPAHPRKVKFYGFDMQFPARSITAALAGLEESDSLAARLGLLRNPGLRRTYDQLPNSKKQDLRAAVDELVAGVASGDSWVRRHAEVVRQYEAMLRNPGLEARDRSMAENVRWIVEHEGPEAKVVVWAHNSHVARQPAPWMGHWLAGWFGDDYLAFGFSFDRGSFQARARLGTQVVDGRPALEEHTVGSADRSSIDGLLARAGLPLFALSLRDLPEKGPVSRWMRRDHLMRSIGSMYGPQHEVYKQVALSKHFDAILFFETVSRARPNPLTQQSFGIRPPS